MNIQVTMPQMGESVVEGTLTKWLKKVGEKVEQDEALFEISTDKVDSEIPSPASGILSEILIPEGETVQINTVLAIIRDGDETATAANLEEDDAEKEAAKEPLVVAEEKPSEENVMLNVPVSDLQDIPDVEKPSPSTVVQDEAPSPAIRIQAIRTSPLVRKLAREHNIDLSSIQATGLEGRITREDILKHIDTLSSQKQSPASHSDGQDSVITQTATPDISATEEFVPERQKKPAASQEKPSSMEEYVPRFVGETETVAISPMRKAIAEHMVFSKRTSAHVNTVFEVDLQSIVRLRMAHRDDFERREGVPLTYTPFFAKALVDNVREFPVFNASLSGDTLIYKKPVNLGIAVAIEDGLIVPVIKNAQLKNLTGIALKIADLADRARRKRLKPEDVQDGTISLTNPGRYGALFATPIISQPQVAILGIGGIEKRPIVIEDAIAIRPMVCLSLTFDHRVIDGATADQFMVALKEKLQSWAQWTD